MVADSVGPARHIEIAPNGDIVVALRNLPGRDRSLVPGGILVVEPWLRPDDWHVGHMGALLVDEPDVKIARMSVSQQEGTLSIIEFHYLVATSTGVEHHTERHELGLFTDDEYRGAFAASGLELIYDDHGLSGRGLYVGSRSP